jgi:hypothetical protein
MQYGLHLRRKRATLYVGWLGVGLTHLIGRCAAAACLQRAKEKP